MRCAACDCENPADARFCERCGSPVSVADPSAELVVERREALPVCPNCGAERRPGLSFCEQCAAPLPEEPPMGAVLRGLDSPVSVPPLPPQPSLEVASSSSPAASTPERVAVGGRVCTACGYLNPVAACHCADCGGALSAPREAAPARPSAISRVLSVVVRIAVSGVIAVVTAAATRYVLSYVINLGLIP